MKYKYVHGIQCPICDEKIWSTYRHDFHHCECGYCFVDGGKWYLRFGWGFSCTNDDGTYEEFSMDRPKAVKFRVPLKDWLDSDRAPRRKIRDLFPY